MVDKTLIKPLNKGQGHLFLVPIDFSYTTSYRLSIVTFALGRTVLPQYITSQTDDDRRTQHCSISATVVRSAKNCVYLPGTCRVHALFLLHAPTARISEQYSVHDHWPTICLICHWSHRAFAENFPLAKQSWIAVTTETRLNKKMISRLYPCPCRSRSCEAVIMRFTGNY